MEAFRTPLYNGKAKLTTHKVRPTCSNNVPVTEHETFKPSVITTPSGKTVLDFGQIFLQLQQSYPFPVWYKPHR